MQTKKKEVEDKIRLAGLKIFEEEGFEKASLRRIVKEAGTTLGNFYNYFESKEALFDALVRESYEGFNWFLKHHEDDMPRDEGELDKDLLDRGMEVLKIQVRRLIPHLNRNFLLLLEASKGTVYEDFSDSVTDFFAGHYRDHLRDNHVVDPIGYDQVAGSMFVSGLVVLIKGSQDEGILTAGVMQHFLFFTFGTLGVIDLNRGN